MQAMLIWYSSRVLYTIDIMKLTALHETPFQADVELQYKILPICVQNLVDLLLQGALPVHGNSRKAYINSFTAGLSSQVKVPKIVK